MTKTTFQQELSTPRPDVFRLAAEFVQTRVCDYSCDALTEAVVQTLDSFEGLSNEEVVKIDSEYQSQYAAMFGPETAHDWFAGMTGHHPFWNARLSLVPNPGEVVQARVNALSFMAAITENPIVPGEVFYKLPGPVTPFSHLKLQPPEFPKGSL